MDASIEAIEPQPVVGIRSDVHIEEIGDRIGELMAELAPYAWVVEQGLQANAAPWEQYTSDCANTPPERIETRIVCPVA